QGAGAHGDPPHRRRTRPRAPRKDRERARGHRQGERQAHALLARQRGARARGVDGARQGGADTRRLRPRRGHRPGGREGMSPKSRPQRRALNYSAAMRASFAPLLAAAAALGCTSSSLPDPREAANAYAAAAAKGDADAIYDMMTTSAQKARTK